MSHCQAATTLPVCALRHFIYIVVPYEPMIVLCNLSCTIHLQKVFIKLFKFSIADIKHYSRHRTLHLDRCLWAGVSTQTTRLRVRRVRLRTASSLSSTTMFSASPSFLHLLHLLRQPWPVPAPSTIPWCSAHRNHRRDLLSWSLLRYCMVWALYLLHSILATLAWAFVHEELVGLKNLTHISVQVA